MLATQWARLREHYRRTRHPLSRTLVVSFGLPKSASTFAWLILRDVLREGGAPVVRLSTAAKGAPSDEDYVERLSPDRLRAIRDEIGTHCAIVKTHGPAPTRKEIAAAGFKRLIVFAQHRDPRDIALSLIDHGNRSRAAGIRDFVECETVERSLWTIGDALERLESWIELGDVHLVSYDELCFDTEAAVAGMANVLGMDVDTGRILERYADKTQISQFNKGTPERWRTEMSEEDVARVTAAFPEYYARFA